MPHITTCTTCGMLYEEISEEQANAPARECGECWSRRNDARLANEWAAQAQSQNGEWVMVPVEPTKAMLDATAGMPMGDGIENRRNERKQAWRAMLAAAPQQAAEPVAITKDSDDLYTGWLSWTGKELPPGTKLYTHPQPAQDAKDAARLDWLEAHPRLASIVIDGSATDCYLYGISGAPGLKLREILDAAMVKESGR